MTTPAPIYSDINLWVGRFSNDVMVYDYDAINQNIFLIITTPIRSKWFDIYLGSNIPKYLFEPMDATTAGDIRSEIATLLTRNGERRVQLLNVSVTPNYVEQAYACEVTYLAPSIGDQPYTFRFGLNKQHS